MYIKRKSNQMQTEMKAQSEVQPITSAQFRATLRQNTTNVLVLIMHLNIKKLS